MTKTEHEKLLAGEEYNYRDPGIRQMLSRARKLLPQVNDLNDLEQRNKAIYELFNHVGKNLVINGKISVLYGNHLTFGDDDFINDNVRFQDSNLITLGDRVIVAPDVKFYCGEHAIDAQQRWGQAMALGTGGGFGDRWWLWGHGVFGDMVALGTGNAFGGTVALRTNGGSGDTVALRTGGGTVQAEVPAVPPAPPRPHTRR